MKYTYALHYTPTLEDIIQSTLMSPLFDKTREANMENVMELIMNHTSREETINIITQCKAFECLTEQQREWLTMILVNGQHRLPVQQTLNETFTSRTVNGKYKEQDMTLLAYFPEKRTMRWLHELPIIQTGKYPHLTLNYTTLLTQTTFTTVKQEQFMRMADKENAVSFFTLTPLSLEIYSLLKLSLNKE